MLQLSPAIFAACRSAGLYRWSPRNVTTAGNTPHAPLLRRLARTLLKDMADPQRVALKNQRGIIMNHRVVFQVLAATVMAAAIASAQGTGVPAVDPTAALTVSGPVVAFVAGPGSGHPTMTVSDAARGEMSFILGPFRYLESVAFSAATGDQVEALLYSCPVCTAGWVAARVDNLTNGSSAVLRDSSGVPLWTGRGMGGGGRAGAGRAGAGRRAMGRAAVAGPAAGSSQLAVRQRQCGGAGLDMSAVSTATGTVKAFTGGPGEGTPTLTLQTAAGDLDILVSPYRTLAAADLSLDTGRSLEIVYAPVAGTDGELLAAVSLTDTGTGLTVQLRDPETGTPSAAGRGRRACR